MSCSIVMYFDIHAVLCVLHTMCYILCATWWWRCSALGPVLSMTLNFIIFIFIFFKCHWTGSWHMRWAQVVCQSPSCAPKQYDPELASAFEPVTCGVRSGGSTTRPYCFGMCYILCVISYVLDAVLMLWYIQCVMLWYIQCVTYYVLHTMCYSYVLHAMVHIMCYMLWYIQCVTCYGTYNVLHAMVHTMCYMLWYIQCVTVLHSLVHTMCYVHCVYLIYTVDEECKNCVINY